MWLCHKCSKPVYFAERKQSLGYDWHPECLRCEECGKRLNPGQHAEHKSVPYCHVPCYGALFGPQLFGHGTRVESHKSFGAKGNTPRPVQNGPSIPREQLEIKLKEFNETSDNKGQEIRSREVNGRLVLEGALRIYWGVQGVIHLKEDDDQRTVVTVRKRNSCRYSNSTEFTHSEKSPLLPQSAETQTRDGNDTGTEISTSSILDGGDTTDISMTESISMDTFNDDVHSIPSEFSSKEVSPEHKSNTLPSKLKANLAWEEVDELIKVERKLDASEKLYQTMPSPLPSQSSSDPDSSDSRTPLLSAQPQSPSTDESEKTDTDFKSAVVSISPEATQTPVSDKKSDEYLTPINTLKAVDFDEFKKQMCDEFIQNSSQLQHLKDDTLKSRQPIDPSRINDSLKLYSEQIMSKSFSGEAALRICPSNIQYQTLKNVSDSQSIESNHGHFALKKCGSAVASVVPEDELLSSSERLNINRSKSGPNWYRNNTSGSDDSETLKPSTIKRSQNFRSINIKMDCYDELSDRPEANGDSISSAVTTVTPTDSITNTSNLYPVLFDDDDEEEVVLRRKKTGSTAIKRRSGNKRSRAKLKRRCSINGHFYNRETSFFTPPRGSQMSVWVSSLVSTQEVVNLLLEKYKVDSRPENFALYIIRDNGEQRRLKDDDYPLLTRIILGPHEDVSRIFLMDTHTTTEISCEVAQFINLSVQECKSILDRYEEERLREAEKIKDKYAELRRRIIQRMESLKVRL